MFVLFLWIVDKRVCWTTPWLLGVFSALCVQKEQVSSARRATGGTSNEVCEDARGCFRTDPLL